MLGDNSYCTMCGLPVKIDKVLRDVTQTTVLGVSAQWSSEAWRYAALGSIWQYHRVPKDASAYLSPMLAGQYQQHLLRYYRGNVSVGKCYEPAIQRLTYEQASICIQAQRLIVNRIGFRGRRFPLCPDPHRMRGRAPHQRWWSPSARDADSWWRPRDIGGIAVETD